MAIVRELFEAGLDVRPFGANALEPTGRSCAGRGDRLEPLPSGDLRQHAFQTLGFLKLVHDQPSPPQYRFRNIDFVQAIGGAARTCKPAPASARVSMPFHITSLNRPFDGDDR